MQITIFSMILVNHQETNQFPIFSPTEPHRPMVTLVGGLLLRCPLDRFSTKSLGGKVRADHGMAHWVFLLVTAVTNRFLEYVVFGSQGLLMVRNGNHGY